MGKIGPGILGLLFFWPGQRETLNMEGCQPEASGKAEKERAWGSDCEDGLNPSLPLLTTELYNAVILPWRNEYFVSHKIQMQECS